MSPRYSVSPGLAVGARHATTAVHIVLLVLAISTVLAILLYPVFLGSSTARYSVSASDAGGACNINGAWYAIIISYTPHSVNACQGFVSWHRGNLRIHERNLIFQRHGQQVNALPVIEPSLNTYLRINWMLVVGFIIHFQFLGLSGFKIALAM